MPGSSRFTVLSKGLNRQRGKMNKTESLYADGLEQMKREGIVSDWWYEPFTLRLSRPDEGQPAKVTPDFMVLMPDGTTYIDDVKGTGIDDNAAAVRMKTAAEQYPLWKFRIVKRRPKKQGGGWKISIV